MVTRKLKPKPRVKTTYSQWYAGESKRQRKLRQHRDLHGSFRKIIEVDITLRHGLVAEHKFNPVRQYAFDFAWPHLKIGIDLQGGIYNPGRRTGHTSIKGMENDMEKLNLAMTNGWLVLLFSPNKVYYEQKYVFNSVMALHRLRKQE